MSIRWQLNRWAALDRWNQPQRWLRGLTTNHARLDPQSTDPQLQPQRLTAAVTLVADQIERWAGDQPRWSLVSRVAMADGIELHLIRRTRLFKFTDDVRVRLSRQGAETVLTAESRSRLGKGDLGQNPRNLKELVSAIAAAR